MDQDKIIKKELETYQGFQDFHDAQEKDCEERELAHSMKAVEFTVDIAKEDLPKRIKSFVNGITSSDREELASILSSLAHYGAAESIRWIFLDGDLKESTLDEIIRMSVAKKLDDPELF